MATLQMLINLFPVETGGIQLLALLLLAVVALTLGFAIAVICRRAARRRTAIDAALQHGLTGRSAQFLAQLLQREPTGAAEPLLTAPDLLIRRLAQAIGRQPGTQAALLFAADAARLLDELGLRDPAFPGAPLPCDALLLTDPDEPAGPGVTVFLVATDEKNLVAVSPSACPWPLRRNLRAVLQPPPVVGGAPAQALSEFSVALLLRPMPPKHEWVLTHALVETISNRRASVRVPCRIETVALPDAGEPPALRLRLQREERVPLEELRGSRAWSQRLSVTVVDLSADGARLVLDQPLARHQRLHLLLASPDDMLLALPLGEVVDSRHDDAGRTVVGVRFIGVRMKERLCLAEQVRALGAGAATAAARGAGRPRDSGV